MNDNVAKIVGETQLQAAIGVLLESLSDKNPTVKQTVEKSLRKLASKHSNQILISSCQFCKKTPKPTNEHVSIVLSVISAICTENIINIDGDTIIDTIEFNLQVMLQNPGYDPVLQIPASNVLISVGRQHYIQVMDTLLNKLLAGSLPHYMVLHTLGSLANANAYAVVPYLKNILSLILPVLSNVRSDSLKQAFSYALQNFCEALIEYESNIEQMPDNTIVIEDFQTEISMAYDALFAGWLHSKEPKVTESVLDALAAIFKVLSVEKVSQQTSKAVSCLINLYRKNINAYNITKCLYSIIEKASNVNGTLLEPLITNVLNVLIDLVCVSPDYAQPDLLRSHSEVLRCYECFALHFTDHTIDKLLVQLKNNNDKEKIKALIVITHLISYSGDQTIQRRFKDILKYLNEMLLDNNIRVKKALVKIIVALAHKKVIINKDLNPEGPERFMEFILKMCCRQVVPKSYIDTSELLDIQKSSDNSLYLLCTSVPELENILWSLFITSFLSSDYDDALVILLRCLTYIASKRERMDSCEALFIRCITLLANPFPNLRGNYVLNFLKNIRPCAIASYKFIWDTKIIQLIKYLEQNYDNIDLHEWHKLLFDFLNLLLGSIKNESYNEILVIKSKEQLEIYNDNRYMSSSSGDYSVKYTEKQFLLKCLGIILCHLSNKEIVLQSLDNILVNVKLTDFSELHACAEAVGICSRKHLDLVLQKLEQIRKDVFMKKHSKFLQFSFMKDQRQGLGMERLRYVIIYSYSEVCNEAPTDKLVRVVQNEILEYILNELDNTKDFAIRKVCLKAIQSVADTMHPNRNTLHIRMNERDKVIQAVSAQFHLHNGPEYVELFPLIIPAITALIRLPVLLETDDRIKLIKLFFDNVFNASAIYCKINNDKSLNSYYGDLKLVPYVTKSFSELNQFIQELLLQNLSPATLDEIVTMLEPWLSKKRQEQRLPACETLKLVLQTYLDNMKFAYDCPSNFRQTGFLLSRVIPRCTDPNNNIRRVAIECSCLILCIAARYEGYMRDHDKALNNSFQNLIQKIESDEPKLLYNLTSDLAHIICMNLPQFELAHYIDGLIDALVDVESSSSNGSSVVLNVTLKNKALEVQSHINPIVGKLLKKIDKIQCPRTRSSTVRSVAIIATHYSKIVLTILLSQALPYETYICECWAILSTDPVLALDLIDQLKRIIKSGKLYESQNNGEVKVANLLALQAVCALQEMFKNIQLKDTCLQQFPELFSILFICFASYINTDAPTVTTEKEKYSPTLNKDAGKLNPTKIAIDTFRYFLLCCEFNKIASCLLFYPHVDKIDDNKLFVEIIAHLVECICTENPACLSWLVNCLAPHIRAEHEPQRIAVVAFFTNLLKNKINHQSVLVENLMEMVLDVQLDQSCFVKKIALQGLGYAAENLNTDLISRHCNPILCALMNSLDYNNIGNESEVILEGMLSLSKLLTALEGFKFSSFQVTAAVRIKPLLAQEDVDLRRASFRLLGDLTQSLNTDSNLEAFTEQIQGNLVTLLLHLCDPDVYVIKACKYTLRKVTPYINCSKVNSMIQEHLIDEANLHYEDFIRDLIKLLAEDLQNLFPLFIMTSLSYLKSQWVEIRSNAALLCGLLYAESTVENRHKVSLDALCDKLMRLTHDEHEQVRTGAVQSITYLFLN